jgi:hypothetical protein
MTRDSMGIVYRLLGVGCWLLVEKDKMERKPVAETQSPHQWGAGFAAVSC